jgi:hypothetical protein
MRSSLRHGAAGAHKGRRAGVSRGTALAPAIRDEQHSPGSAVAPFRSDTAEARAVHRARGGAMSDLQLDRAGRRRSPATMPGFLAGRSPRNKGLRYRGRPRHATGLAARPPRQGRTMPRGWHGRLGLGELQPWLELRLELPSDRCSALSLAELRAGRGQRRLRVRSSAAPRRQPVCVAALRRTSSATPMPSRWPARACRWS